MPKRPGTLTVSLTPELDRYLRDKVASGHYSSISEVIREALRGQQQREQQDTAFVPPSPTASLGVRQEVAG